MWSVSSKDGTRWFEHSGSAWSADPHTEALVREHAGAPVRIAPMGDLYAPTSPDDELGLYLLARQFVPAPHNVRGSQPAVPAASPAAAGTVH
jgi:hypothetical protein